MNKEIVEQRAQMPFTKVLQPCIDPLAIGIDGWGPSMGYWSEILSDLEMYGSEPLQ